MVRPEASTYNSVSGHLAIHVVCFLRSALLNTYPERLQEEFLSNNFFLIYPLESLLILKMSHLSVVTNTLHKLTFSNESHFESALIDHLLSYLGPFVHYPSVVVPVIVLVIVLIPLICLVKKALARLPFQLATTKMYTYCDTVKYMSLGICMVARARLESN